MFFFTIIEWENKFKYRHFLGNKMVTRNLREIDQVKSLINYLQRNLRKGYKLDDLKWSLIGQGHSRVSVDKAIEFVREIEEAKKKEIPEKIEIIRPVDIPVKEEKTFLQKLKSFFG